MAETDDAYTLVSPAKHPMEMIYADYANSMKSLANQARMEMVNTGNLKYNSSAKSTYQKEVDSLMSKLNTAELNTVRERAAQRMAQAELQSKKAAGQIEKSDEKKVGTRALNKYRTEVGSVTRKKRNIDITDLEWEAIQAGAISDNQLTRILNNTDTAKLRERATPRSNGNTLRTAQVNRIKAMASSNYTLEQIAAKLGVSPTTVSKYLKGVK
jgi:AraC-like DNA-binding protein